MQTRCYRIHCSSLFVRSRQAQSVFQGRKQKVLNQVVIFRWVFMVYRFSTSQVLPTRKHMPNGIEKECRQPTEYCMISSEQDFLLPQQLAKSEVFIGCVCRTWCRSSCALWMQASLPVHCGKWKGISELVSVGPSFLNLCSKAITMKRLPFS